MCAEAKTNRVSLVNPYLNTIEQLLGELWRCTRDRSVQSLNRRQLRLLSIKNWRGFPRTLCNVTCFWSDLVMRQLLLQERVMSVLGQI